MCAWSAQSEILVHFCITQTSIFLLFSTMWLIAEKHLMMHLQNSISSTFSICCWRYQVAALTSEACYCGNQQHGFVASDCFNTSSSGGTKDDRGERQRWDGLLPFPLSFSVTSAPLIHAWIHQWPRTAVFFLPSWVKHLRQYHVFFFCVCVWLVNLVLSSVSPTFLLEVNRDVWPSTELKDHFCTAFVCLRLRTMCRRERLLSWKFLETWLDAPNSPQVAAQHKV